MALPFSTHSQKQFGLNGGHSAVASLDATGYAAVVSILNKILARHADFTTFDSGINWLDSNYAHRNQESKIDRMYQVLHNISLYLLLK